MRTSDFQIAMVFGILIGGLVTIISLLLNSNAYIWFDLIVIGGILLYHGFRWFKRFK